MTIQQLECMLAVFRHGSISKAAASLFIAQSNLSTMLRNVEEELDFTVFVRTNKGIQPTEQGMLFLRHAASLCEEYHQMLDACKQTNYLKFRMSGTYYAPVYDSFTKLCQHYADQPQLDFSYQVLPYSAALDKLCFAELDLAVLLISPDSLSNFKHTAKEKNLALQVLGQIPIVLRIGPSHPLYRCPEIRLADFQNYTYVDYPRSSVLDNPQVRDLVPIRSERMVHVSSSELRKQLISQSTMYCVGCKLPHALNKQYSFRNIPLGDIHYLLITLTRKSEAQSLAVRNYITCLSDELQDL